MISGRNKIKVLFVQEPAGGGSLIALYEMIRALDTQVIDPVVVCYYKSRYTAELEKLRGCRVIYAEEFVRLDMGQRKFTKSRLLNVLLIQYYAIKKYFIDDRRLVKFFADLIRDEDPDIVHHNNDIIVNRCSVRAAIRMGKQQLLYNHGLPVYNNGFFDRVADFFLLHQIDFHLHLTKAIGDHYRKLFRWRFEHSAVLHSFIDRRVFKPGGAVPAVLGEFGISSDEIIITDIGRITHWKGQHVLLQAVAAIKNKLPPFRVLMVGSSEKRVGSSAYSMQLQELVCRYGLQQNVIFTGNRNDVADIINTSHVIVHTAVKPEPQGIVIIEALLCRKPVIASDDAGSAELVKKYGGILFKPGDANSLGEILVSLFTQSGQSGMSIDTYPEQFERLDRDFSTAKQAEQLQKIYFGVLQK